MAIQTKHFDAWLDKVPEASDKVMAITGTTSGTGYWASVFAIRKNVKALLLLNRESPRVHEAYDKLVSEKKHCGSSTLIYKINCDLMDFKSVREAAKEVNELCESLGGLNILANNAGFGPVADYRANDGYDAQMQVNYLSHYLLAKSVFPSFNLAMNNGQEVRICHQSSGARYMTKFPHEEKYFERIESGKLGGNAPTPAFERYHQSKLACLTFALKLSQELEQKGYDTNKIKSLCTEPGFSETNLVTNSAKGNSFFIGQLSKVVIWVMSQFMKRQSAADGSLTLAHACLAENIENGDFIQPIEYDVGTPVKAISGGRLVNGKPEHEKLTLDPLNHELCWKMSEAALGDFFEFSNQTQ